MDIKFMAWDKAKKQFIPPHWVAIDGLGKVYNNSLENVSYNPKDWVLRWYTGLKDYHSEEIYTGDIIDWQGNLFVVKIANGLTWGEPKSGNKVRGLLDTYHFRDGIITGNIYESIEPV